MGQWRLRGVVEEELMVLWQRLPELEQGVFMYWPFFFPAEDGIRGHCVTGVQTCALPIYAAALPETPPHCPDAVGGFHGPRTAQSQRQCLRLDVWTRRLYQSDRAGVAPAYWSLDPGKIGRASCRERGSSSVLAVS